MPNYCFENSRAYGRQAKALRRQAPMVERLVWNALSALRIATGLKFRRQHPVPPYFADFACVKARLIIELDGASHDTRQIYDSRREAALRGKGWTILRFSNEDVRNNLDGVVSMIVEKAESCLRDNLPAHP